jgi:cobalamin biosynthesis protein CobD/CbiB
MYCWKTICTTQTDQLPIKNIKNKTMKEEDKETQVIRGLAVLLAIMVTTAILGTATDSEIILWVAFVSGLVMVLSLMTVLLLAVFDKI